MNAISNALSSPDILHHIFSLDILTQADLRSACLVHSDWAAAGLILLWRYPRMLTLGTFQRLLDTLRHEVDQSGPIDSTATSSTSANALPVAALAHRSFSIREKRRPGLDPTPSLSFALLPSTYRPSKKSKEYGIPFHGQRIFHRAQFIRALDFRSLAGSLSLYHFEVLGRSAKIGFRALDLRTVQLPFNKHLLSILLSCKTLTKLCLENVHIPVEALECMEDCLSTLTELRLIDCPATMGDDELGIILQHCSRLRTLELHGESFSDKSLVWIAKTCLALETLVLKTPLMTDAVVEQISVGCPQLTKWSLVNCLALDHESLTALKERYSMSDPWANGAMDIGRANWTLTGHNGVSTISTTAIAVSNSSTASPSSPTASCSTWSTISSADSSVISSPLSSSSLSSSMALESTPTSLELPLLKNHHHHQQQQHHHVPGPFAAHRNVRSHGLCSIEFRNCPEIRPQIMNSFLRSQPQLEHLTLGGPSVTDDALVTLTELPFVRLKSLGLLHCGDISDETMVAVLFNCDQMTRLSIFGSNFTRRTFSAISIHLRGLEELQLEHVPLILNESVQEIMDMCAELRVLRLWHCRHLTQDLFTDARSPCPKLEELDYMDKYPRPFAESKWENQVKFLQSIVIRFELLKVLRLTKLAENYVPVNLVSYLCQLDQLEKFYIVASPRMDYIDLQELRNCLPTLVEIGLGPSKTLPDEEILSFNQTYTRPCVRTVIGMIDSSENFYSHVK